MELEGISTVDLYTKNLFYTDCCFSELYLIQPAIDTGRCKFNHMYHTIAATSIISLIGTFHEIVFNSSKVKKILALRCYNTVCSYLPEIFVLFSNQ